MMSEEEAYETVQESLQEEGILPFKPDELDIISSIENCINCGTCINYCPVVAAVGVNRFSGPRSIAVELSRSPPEFWSTGDMVYLCTGCGTCREVCPKNVNIPEIVNIIRARIFEHRPDLVPKGLHVVREIILEHHLAFEPWDDEEERKASRDMRRERFGLPAIPDRVVKDAGVLFYPGCQAEEIAQEVKEAGKAVLEFFEVDYTLLGELSCCGLPSRLMGDDMTARELADELKAKIDDLGIEKIVTTCAGCTSNLSYLASRDHWDVPVYHLVEYLTEIIGLDKLRENTTKETRRNRLVVTVHDPCHLIRHTSRQLMQEALEILDCLPGVEVSLSEAEDSCCGGGGLVAYHSDDVADAVTQENVDCIEQADADRVVTPCPLCTAQLEARLFKSGSSIDVDDLSVFVAQYLPLEEGLSND
ncbi:MAG: (Fe-S)-binding protein [Promethearchaeia archaeon]